MSYARNQQIIADENYYSDPRVRAAKGKWYKSFCRETMSVTITIYREPNDDDFCGEDDDSEEVDIILPVHFVVCGTCNGKGTHVNPSIDSHGLGQEDFERDPDFAEDYFSGRYDVTCYDCGGENVVPEITEDRCTPEQKEALKAHYEYLEDEARFEAECRMERMMGC